MAKADRKPRLYGDLALCGFVFLAAALLFAGTAGLPPPRFEPLGSAALPRILATLLIVFGVIIAGKALYELFRTAPASDPKDAVEADPGFDPRLGIYVFVLLCAYVSALDFFSVPFVAASAVFLGLVGFTLSRWQVKAGLIYTVIGLVVGLVLDYIFTQFLYISFG